MGLKHFSRAAVAVIGAACMLLGAIPASAEQASTYDISQVGSATLTAFTSKDGKTAYKYTVDGTTHDGSTFPYADTVARIGIGFVVDDISKVKPGDVLTVPLHTDDTSFIPLHVGTIILPEYLTTSDGAALFRIEDAGTRQAAGNSGRTELDGLTLTALDAVSVYSGRATMSLDATMNLYPGRATHFNRTETRLTVGSKTYTIPNDTRKVDMGVDNKAHALGTSQDYGSATLQMTARSAGWVHSLLSNDKTAAHVKEQAAKTRVMVAKVTPLEGATITGIQPVNNIQPDDLRPGYDETTFGTVWMLIDHKPECDTPQELVTGLTEADMTDVDALSTKLPEHRAAVVKGSNGVWYVAVNFGKFQDDPKLGKDQSAYGDAMTQALFDNMRKNNLPYPDVQQSFKVSFDKPGEVQKAETSVTFNKEWSEGWSSAMDKVYPEAWGLVTSSTSGSADADKTVYHTVTFDAKGGTNVASQIVADKGKAKEATTTRSGYTFDGWYLDGTKYDFDTPVTGDITLKASWRKAEATAADATLHKRVAKGSKTGTYRLTLDVTGSGSSAMRAAAITDPLSDWVDPVGLEDGKATGITVTKNGTAMKDGYTASYSSKARTVTVSFDDALEDGVTYAVSFEVTPSQKAKTAYVNGEAYPDTGDADTGDTSSGKKGYASNGDARLSWDDAVTVDGVTTITPSYAAYPKPVIQIPAGLAPSRKTDNLPGTGAKAAFVPILAGVGVIVALGCAWVIRKRLS